MWKRVKVGMGARDGKRGYVGWKVKEIFLFFH